jgi:hypothetical protein
MSSPSHYWAYDPVNYYFLGWGKGRSCTVTPSATVCGNPARLAGWSILAVWTACRMTHIPLGRVVPTCSCPSQPRRETGVGGVGSEPTTSPSMVLPRLYFLPPHDNIEPEPFPHFYFLQGRGSKKLDLLAFLQYDRLLSKPRL